LDKSTKQKVKSVALEVIDFFIGIPESITYAFDRKEFYRLINGRETQRVLTCQNITKLLGNLKRSGYVEIVKDSEAESVRFTNKARLAIIDNISARCVSDHKTRLVSFDIPERLRSNRDKFRRTIKRLGFVQVQKSLWVCDKNVGDLVELAASEYGVDAYVVYIIAEKTNIDGYILKSLDKTA